MTTEDDVKVQMRITLLNVPDDLSPLKLNGYLQREAADIQASTTGNGVTMIRLFLPDRIRLVFTQRKLDALLDKIVSKHPNIYRIELRVVKSALRMEEMQEAAEEAKADMDAIAEAAGLKPTTPPIAPGETIH